MYGFDQPHPVRRQSEPHAAVIVGASRELFRWVLPVHGYYERARERTVLVRQANGKILTGTKRLRILFGHEFERKAEGPVALSVLRRP